MPRHAIVKLRLRELSVRKAEPKATAYAMWDTKQHGLALRVQPTTSSIPAKAGRAGIASATPTLSA